MLIISSQITIPDDEIEFNAIRAQGSGGQNVNKVSTAIHLRFNIADSSLPEDVKEKLLSLKDHRISNEGVLVIKAQQYRSQEKNREDALDRLKQLILTATAPVKKRTPSKPTRSSVKKRLDSKTRQGQKKALRGQTDW